MVNVLVSNRFVHIYTCKMLGEPIYGLRLYPIIPSIAWYWGLWYVACHFQIKRYYL